MKRKLLMLGVASLLVGATQLMAQAKPSFAGSWTLVPDPAAAADAGGARRGGGGGGFGGLGNAATIAQDASTLTITRTTQAGETKSVYKLDGSESKNTMAGRNGAAGTETTSTAKWDANKLVISTNVNFNGTAITTSMSLSLDASGQLIVESSGFGRGGAAPTPTKTTYKKG